MPSKKEPIIEPFYRWLPEDQTGLAIRKNKKNGFLVIELDFTANPYKRDPAWIERERKAMAPKDWAIEMMRSRETYSGRAIYEGAFFRHLHVPASPLDANPNFPIFRGWDFGGNQSVVIAQIVDGRIIVLDELPNAGGNTLKFAPEVIAFCNIKYGSEMHYIDVIDPSAMWEGKTAGGKACSDVMRDFGLIPIPAPTNDPIKRIYAVISLLQRLKDGKPCLTINPDCTTLIRGFEGGYHYPEKQSQAKKIDSPVKNLYSHVHDALQYVCLRAVSHTKARQNEQVEYEKTQITSKYKFGGTK